MKAVISSTYDHLYFFFLPIVTWSWNKIGCDVIWITPKPELYAHLDMFRLALEHSRWREKNFSMFYEAPEHKAATYAQCARLYAACSKFVADDEVLMTGDVDMAVFNPEYFQQANNGQINVLGADLVPLYQYPICYISMPVKTWKDVMGIEPGDTIQKHLDYLLGNLECDHFRGNYWAKDQETIYRKLTQSDFPVVKHYRAKWPTQFATHRADRDGWPEVAPPGIIDAHLPRPGYTEENFAKILKLFQEIYPDEDFTWMVNYRNEYIKLL